MVNIPLTVRRERSDAIILSINGDQSLWLSQAIYYSIINTCSILRSLFFSQDYLGQSEIDLNFLEYYGEKETEDIHLKLLDASSGDVVLSMSYKIV
jgi:hypothetical protein